MRWRRWVAPPDRQTLAEAFDPRSNALSLMRLGLAGTVAVVHAMAVGFGYQPVLGSATLGDLAVDGFFVLSGFLVTMSFLRLRSLRRYAWHRFLRIMPAFWTCLLLTALVLAPVVALLSGRSPTSVFVGAESSWDYLGRNAGLLMQQFGISGLPANPAQPDVLNGALWTLFYEAVCYGGVAALGVFGVLRSRRGLVLLVVVVAWVLTLLKVLGLDPLDSDIMLRLGFVFLLGATGYLFADRIPVRADLAVLSAALVVTGLYLLPDYRVLGAMGFAYLCLYGMVRLPMRQNPSLDLSYGVYIYHWPLQQLLVLLGATALTVVPFVLLSVTLAVVAATASWLLVESPALRAKGAEWVTAPLPGWWHGRRSGR